MKITIKPVSDFDARKGFRRWVFPGMGIDSALADIWLHETRGLFVRFSSLGYSCSYKIEKIDNSEFNYEDEGIVSDFIESTLLLWLCEGVDDDVHEYLELYEEVNDDAHAKYILEN